MTDEVTAPQATTHIDDQNQTCIAGNVNTGGGDLIGRDKHIHGDEVAGNKIVAGDTINIVTNHHAINRTIINLPRDLLEHPIEEFQSILGELSSYIDFTDKQPRARTQTFLALKEHQITKFERIENFLWLHFPGFAAEIGRYLGKRWQLRSVIYRDIITQFQNSPLNFPKKFLILLDSVVA